jgi:enoyl-CoA hydratase/carnithine racemase
VTLRNPERRNAQTPSTWHALAALGEALPATVRVVVVIGEGSSFCAGIDRRLFTPEGIAGEPGFGEMSARPDAEAMAVIASYQAGFSWLRRPQFVSIAAVQGHAIGAGFQLALACDLRVAADDAQFTMAEPTLGLVPDLGGTQPLVELVGYSRALELCATGRRFGAVEAERAGLVSLVVPSEALISATEGLVASVLTTNVDAVRATKELLLGAAGRSYDDQLLAERTSQIPRIRAMTAGFDT